MRRLLSSTLASTLASLLAAGCGLGNSVVGGGDAAPDDLPDATDSAADLGFDLGPSDLGFDLGPSDLGSDVAPDRGPPDIGFDVGDIGNANCEAPTVLVDGTVLPGEDLSRAVQRVRGCLTTASGPSLFYRVVVGAFDTLAITVRPASDGPTLQPAVRVLPGCATDRCIAQGVLLTTGGTTSWTNYSDSPQPVLVAVGNAIDVAAGRYQLEASIGTGSGNGTCARATAVTLGTPLRNQTFADASDIRGPCPGTTAVAGANLYYRLSAPPRQVIAISVPPTAGTTATTGPSIRLIDSCDSATCVAFSGRGATGQQSLRWFNEGATPRDLLVAVSAPATTATPLHFDLLADLASAPLEAFCSAALEVTPAFPRRAQDTTSAAQPTPACAGGNPSGDALWYRATVPANTLFTARITRTSGATDPLVRLFDRCGGTCLDATSGTSGSVARALWLNPLATPAAVFFTAASSSNSVMGFDAEVIFSTAAANARCATAAPLVAGSRLAREDLAGAFEAPPACMGTGVAAPTASLWYGLTVPAGRTLVASARRLLVPGDTSAWSPNLRLLAACGAAAQCLGGSSAGGDTTTAHLVARASTLPGPALLAVGSSTAAASGPFELAVDYAAPPTNLTCAAAEALAPAPIARRTGLLVADGGSPAPVCTLTATGGALYFRAPVAPGATLAAYALRTSASGWSPVLELSSGCAGGACLATGAVTAGGSFVRWTNTGTATQDAHLALYGSTPQAISAASLAVAVDTPRYTVERVAADCEEVTDAWTSLGLTSSTGATLQRPLPFALRYFGDAVTSISVSAAGFAQLWADTSRGPSGSSANLSIPTPAAPFGLVAPFWDALTFNLGTTRVAMQEVTDAARHVTIAWSDILLSGMPLSFQLKLFATTDVVEFHYCHLDARDVATGSLATIGLQDVAGLRGVQRSFNTANAVMNGDALRFTPVR